MATHARASDAALFDDLVRTETRLYNHFDAELRAEHGIVTSQYEFLRHVRDAEAPRVTDVAAAFAIGVGAVSRITDRLEARGLVVRQPNPANRRSTILALTDAGRAMADAAEATFLARLDPILAEAGTADDVATAAAVLRRLRTVLERDGLGTPVG